MVLQFQEYGDSTAPLMLFLHGGGVSGYMWDKQIQYFTPDYHCIVPSLPEHGANNDEIVFSIKTAAFEFINLIEEKANGKKVILIGFSLGSQIIIQMLSMKPHLIDYAIINSALVRPIPYAFMWTKPMVSFSFPLIKYRWFAKLQAKTLYLSEEHFHQYYEESKQMKLNTLVRVLVENMTFTIPAAYPSASGKILITVGEKENKMMKQSAKDLIESHLNSTGVLIPKIGHGAPMAKPDLFNRMVERWVNDDELPEELQKMAIRRK